MVLITRREIPKTAPVTDKNTQLVPIRRGIGISLFDLVLLVPPDKRSDNGPSVRNVKASGLAALFESRGFRTMVVQTPGDTAAAPDKTITDLAADARGVLVMCEQGGDVSGVWLAWMLGRTAANGQKMALLPVARRDPWAKVWKLPPLVRDLPYVGMAKAVGDREPSFWVVPAHEPPDSRDAVNLDYWLHDYRS